MKLKEKAVVLHIGRHTSATKKEGIDWKAFVWDKLQFVVMSAFVFVISYLALNYQSVWENINFKWNGARDQQAFSQPLEQTNGTTKPLEAKTLETSVLGSGAAIQASASPSRSFAIPALDAPVYPPDTRVVIPRINKNIPVVGVTNENLIARKWEDLEKDIQEALKNGVVHYPGTALPGEIGNVVFTGHSSYYAWDGGRFKDVFSLLHEVQVGDRVFVFSNQKKYVYEVFDIRVVKPTEIDVLAKTNDERLTLITCTPLGTNLKRLIVTAKRVE